MGDKAAMVCTTCGYHNPPFFDTCKSCAESALSPYMCSRDSRMGDFFDELHRQGLWPTTKKYVKLSPAEIVQGLEDMDLLGHRCENGERYSLLTELMSLQWRCASYLEELCITQEEWKGMQ